MSNALHLALEALEQSQPTTERAVLTAILETLERANKTPVITDTIWHSNCETLFDFISARIEALEATPRPQQAIAALRDAIAGDAPTELVRTAPERIWLQVSDEKEAHSRPFPSSPHGDEVTWCQHQVLDAEVEYVRADLYASPQPAAPQPDAERYLTLRRGGYLDHLVGELHPCDESRREEFIDRRVDEWRGSQPAAPQPAHRLISDREYLELFQRAQNGSTKQSGILRGIRACIAAYEAVSPTAAPRPVAVPHIHVTEEMHVAAVKVLHRANGLGDLPQRMMDAMLAAAPQAPQAPQVPQPVAVPSHDRLREIARSAEAVNGPSDTTPKTAYVAAGWSAALAAAPQAPSRDWFSVTEIAEAAQYAEVSDGQFTSMLIALNDAFKARAYGITKEGGKQ